MNKRRLGLLTGTHAVNDLYQGLVPALLPFMALERGYSYTAVSGLMLAATGLSSVVQPLFGLYADRHPRSWLVPTGFLVAAFGVVLAGLGGSYLLTWLAMVLCGLGIAAYHPPATVAARAAGGASQKAMSVFSVGGTIGASFAPLLAAAVVGAQGLSHSYLLGIPALLMGLVWWAANARSAPATQPAGGTRTRQQPMAQNDWRAFSLLVATIVGWSIPYVMVLSMLSLYVSRELGGSPFMAAAVLTSFTAAGAVGTLSGGWLGDHFGRMRPIRSGYLLAIPMLAGLVAAPSPVVALVCTAGLGVAMFLPFAAQVTLAQDYLPRNPATASGITLGLALSVGGLVSPLFGLLSDAHGLRFTLTAVLCVLGVAALLAFQLRNRAPHVPSATAAAYPAR
ncbi:MFS transporter [Xylophilus sp. ASV27]|uniref:MFS transporter n=1 Tax=Xylophilus sp. ASV27 TaxID=2795129 RepID=UPI0018EE271A|nr:MFS transporter [Xylophilus sp. ASV27]